MEEDSHSTDLSVSGKEGRSTFIGSLHFLGLAEDKVIWQHWLHHKIAQKCLEILLLMYNLHIFSIRPKKVLFFRATYEQLSLQKATFDSFLSNF